jgi:hypothetical protein
MPKNLKNIKINIFKQFNLYKKVILIKISNNKKENITLMTMKHFKRKIKFQMMKMKK